MLRPSYSDLLEVLNRENEDATIGSRYTIVIAAAKRARQLVDHAEPLTNNIRVDKPVSIAVQEMYEGKIKIRERKEDSLENNREEMLALQDDMEEQAEINNQGMIATSTVSNGLTKDMGEKQS